ncbi:MAG TPA: PhzF family phenazine biosynthesis protein [Planctomycetota bacterium]
MTTTPCFHVDAFAHAAFGGNPAAVCLLEAPRPARWMQAVAAEMNLAETAFVSPRRGGFSLRWFTPAVEVALCGHATLASAAVLWAERVVPASRALRFHTRSGVLTCRRAGDTIELDFPQQVARTCAAPAGLAKALGASPRWVGRNRDDYLVELASARAVRSLRPDLAALARYPVRGVIVTARSSTKGFDFVSRFFGPRVGVPEDPVTGSAHCALGPFWAERLGRTTLRGWQASPRGGAVEVEVAGERALLRGRAVVVTRGELLV